LTGLDEKAGKLVMRMVEEAIESSEVIRAPKEFFMLNVEFECRELQQGYLLNWVTATIYIDP